MPIDKEKKGLTAREQSAVNRDYEKNTGKKLPKGQNAALSEEAYKEWKTKGRLNHVYFNPPEPAPPRTDVNKLATKKIQSTMPKADIIKPKSSSTPSNPAPNKFVPEPKTKKLSSGGRSVMGQNVGTAVKNVIGKAKYGRQQKLAEAGKKALVGEGNAGPSSAAKVSALKEKISSLKEIKKTNLRSEAKAGIKEARKGIRYEKKVMKGKDVYKR